MGAFVNDRGLVGTVKYFYGVVGSVVGSQVLFSLEIDVELFC